MRMGELLAILGQYPSNATIEFDEGGAFCIITWYNLALDREQVTILDTYRFERSH